MPILVMLPSLTNRLSTFSNISMNLSAGATCLFCCCAVLWLFKQMVVTLDEPDLSLFLLYWKPNSLRGIINFIIVNEIFVLLCVYLFHWLWTPTLSGTKIHLRSMNVFIFFIYATLYKKYPNTHKTNHHLLPVSIKSKFLYLNN